MFEVSLSAKPNRIVLTASLSSELSISEQSVSLYVQFPDMIFHAELLQNSLTSFKFANMGFLVG